MYGCADAYEMPVPFCWLRSRIHLYTGPALPPLHEPAFAQLSTCCTDNWMSAWPTLPPRAILMRSCSAETAPCAQHDPQYCT